MANKTLNIQTYLYTLQQKGYLAYEYNPFHNYQTNVNLYKVGEFLIPEGKAVDKRNGQILTKYQNKWKNDQDVIIDNVNVIEWNNENQENPKPTIVAGSLIDLDTTQLNFDINHPVDLEIQPSYDGSVNVIFNDDKNIPRLINSRFSSRELNTYEIVDRIGENDTNIYSSDTFDKDSSLYFQYETNPKIEYKGFVNGILPVGQYCFYFTYADADDNESDFIAETGVIPVFIGMDGNSYSMDGGIKNQLSNKGVKLQLKNLDPSYNYLKVYYVRYFADYQQNRVYECKKIYQKYFINSNKLTIQITGNENTEDLDPNVLNLTRFNPKSVLTQAQCKNMLFFANIVKTVDDYKELQDCALRIVPTFEKITDIKVQLDYSDDNDTYYNSKNMYEKVGYFNDEYYRYGVVFIYENGTLSNVYNTVGYNAQNNEEYINSENQKKHRDLKYKGSIFNNLESQAILTRKYINVDNDGWIINADDYFENNNGKLNSKGVCKLPSEEGSYSVKFNIPSEVKEFLHNKFKIRGLFFVRQKRVPNLLAQCYILPMDKQLKAPVLIDGNDKYTECFITQPTVVEIPSFLGGSKTIKFTTDEGKILDNSNYQKRLYKYDSDYNIEQQAYAGICPDFLLNQPYFNQIFNGSRFTLKRVTDNAKIERDTSISDRYYVEPLDKDIDNGEFTKATICTVTENVQSVALKNSIFKMEIGKATEAYRFEYAQYDKGTYSIGKSEKSKDEVNKATNIVRGMYSPYLAIQGAHLQVGELYNIYQENYNDSEQQFLNRMNFNDPFYAISDRYNWDELEEVGNFQCLNCYRGDCYYNVFTYRLNRNFNDASLPNNDKIIDKETWKNNYDAFDQTKWTKISRSDVNAVQLGSWITIKVKSPYNYALRSEDHSYVSEEALMGAPRSFYPRKQNMWLGNYKMPDSYLYNDAYRATLGFKCYFTLEDMNYLKNVFSNRIQYSSIAIQDSFKNNYRESYSTYFRDYSTEYGSITKLVGMDGYLLVVFEHAIGIATINERVLVSEGEGNPVFINTGNVLPEELIIVTDTYGTQWTESVVKSEVGYIYGVDTIAKKIWRVKGRQFEILSDFKVGKFLIDNITLGERDVYPIVGLRNVKTHYNNNKKDIMFTFYDNKDQEKVWNLCYNEILGTFVTFYSWVPSYSENIDTQFFTFDRDTSKALSLLQMSNDANPNSYGVVLDYPVLIKENKQQQQENQEEQQQENQEEQQEKYKSLYLYYKDPKDGKHVDDVYFTIERDHWQAYKWFEINRSVKDGVTKFALNIINEEEVDDYFEEHKTLYLIITPTVNGITKSSETIAISKESIINTITTDFYLHGQSGIFDIKENVYPTHWYGKYHPFEFEFVVNDKIAQQKIFNDLIIISNKAEPESFHFEIEGDNYDFSPDKRTMYFRQESTKELFQNLGSNVIYDKKYTDVTADNYTHEQYYRGNPKRRIDDKDMSETEYTDSYSKIDRVYPVQSLGLVKQVKSSIFPLYYERVDTFDDIYHKYQLMKGDGYDFQNLSGSEIIWNRDLNQFNVVTHIKNSPIDLVGRLRGNSRYKEGKWNIQIPSIIFMQKNENWNTEGFKLDSSKLDFVRLDEEEGNLPPIVINSQNIPKDIDSGFVSNNKLPNIYVKGQYNYNIVTPEDWTYRKEAKIRDKWIKIRVRYSGKNLAIIHSLVTLYNISYS